MRPRYFAWAVACVCALLIGVAVVRAAERPVTPIGELGRDDVGNVVTVSGVVSDTANFSAGFKFVLSDTTGTLAMTLFSRQYDLLDAPAQLNVGARVTATGKLSEYKGALEFVPRDGEKNLVISPPLTVVVPLLQKTGRITATAGQRVVISGTIARVESFSLGVRLYVNDGSGSRRVTVFASVLERVPLAKQLVPGQRLQITGKVSVYRKVAEISPPLPCDVRVLGAGE
jgi:DNA/RNA endonuclease YhcR with UshA esterase domain